MGLKAVERKLCLACNREFVAEFTDLNSLTHCPHDKTQLVNLGPDEHLPWIGKIVQNKYEIIEPLVRARTGMLYKVRDVGTNRLLDLELRKEQLRFDDFAYGQLAKWKQIDHTAIIKLHEFGTIESDNDERSFLIMEAPPRSTHLREKKERNLFWIISIGVQIAEALSIAHQHNLLHSDLSPDSIVLCESQNIDGAKLTGFALCSPTRFSSDTVGMENLVRAALLYASPEECANKPVTEASDIYKLGTVLYEMTVGRVPFKGRTPFETAAAIVYERPSMVELGNARLEKLLTTALQKDPSARFQSMSEFKAALLAV